MKVIIRWGSFSCLPPTEKEKKRSTVSFCQYFQKLLWALRGGGGGITNLYNAYKTWTRILDFMRSLSQFVSWIIYTCWENGQYLANLFKKKKLLVPAHWCLQPISYCWMLLVITKEGMDVHMQRYKELCWGCRKASTDTSTEADRGRW